MIYLEDGRILSVCDKHAHVFDFKGDENDSDKSTSFENSIVESDYGYPSDESYWFNSDSI